MDRYISIPDAASCVRLVEECVEIGVAGENWEQHLASGMAQRVGGDLGLYVSSKMNGGTPDLSTWTFAKGTDSTLQELFAAYRTAGGLQLLPELPIVGPRALRDGEVTYRQSELVSRRDYHASELYQRYMAPGQLEDFLSSVIIQADGTVLGLSIHRCHGQAGFTERDEAVAALLVLLLSNRRPCALGPDAARNLTQRQREVLTQLLKGSSDKEIAASLGISQATAHEHVLKILREFNVASRAKLLAKLLSRRR
jgi:DNA-binding CsgD family transcriptional regulator